MLQDKKIIKAKLSFISIKLKYRHLSNFMWYTCLLKMYNSWDNMEFVQMEKKHEFFYLKYEMMRSNGLSGKWLILNHFWENILIFISTKYWHENGFH